MSVIMFSACTFTEDLTTETTAPAAEVESPASEVEKKLLWGDGKSVFVICMLID